MNGHLDVIKWLHVSNVVSYDICFAIRLKWTFRWRWAKPYTRGTSRYCCFFSKSAPFLVVAICGRRWKISLPSRIDEMRSLFKETYHDHGNACTLKSGAS